MCVWFELVFPAFRKEQQLCRLTIQHTRQDSVGMGSTARLHPTHSSGEGLCVTLWCDLDVNTAWGKLVPSV